MAAKVGDAAPDFKAQAVVGGEFKEISLADYKGKKVVLFFYPLDFTFVCPTELLAFDAKLDEFRKKGAEVIGCSVDSHFSHLAWLNTPRKEGGIQGVRYPILADLDKKISEDYGVLLGAGIALRGVFLIDEKGVLQHMTVNNLPLGRSVDEELRTLDALNFHQKHGEVCPANWQEGGATIKPEVGASKEYFSKVD